jgi:hypothetical protein
MGRTVACDTVEICGASFSVLHYSFFYLLRENRELFFN